MNLVVKSNNSVKLRNIIFSEQLSILQNNLYLTIFYTVFILNLLDFYFILVFIEKILSVCVLFNI